MTFATLALAHAVPTWFMAGLIWFVQVVHYPLFAAVPAASLSAYEHEHVRRTTWVVLPVMLAELGLAIWLAVVAPSHARPFAFGGLGVLAAIWLVTFTMQVPSHDRLAARGDPAEVGRLVRGNWLRTIGWTARAVLALLLLLPSA